VAALAGRNAVQVEQDLAPQAYDMVHEGEAHKPEHHEQEARPEDVDGKAAEDPGREDWRTAGAR
jgi:hypothetical protein